MNLARIIRHLFSAGGVRRHFPARVLDAIGQTIATGETRHAGQVVFAVEGALSVREMLRGLGARTRAHEAFASLRVWDTQHNSGVLIYVLLAERAIEIVADRGIAAKVDESEWKSICTQMQTRFTRGEFEAGAIDGVQAVGGILARHFPTGGARKSNELPDRPVVL